MADLTGVGDTLVLDVPDKGETVSIAVSGTYVMTILFQVEIGSPGSGAFQTLFTFNTVDGTEAEIYVTKDYGERVRLVVAADTSGTAAVTLTEANLALPYLSKFDRVGNLVQSFTQQGVKFPGSYVGGGPIAGTDPMTIDPDSHANRMIVFPAAGGAVTLPAATGTGHRYRFCVEILLTTDLVLNAVSGDVFIGGFMGATDTSGISFIAVPGDDVITLNQTTSGGLAGSFIEIEDVAAGFWMTTGWIVTSGAEGTPFSQV